MAGCSNGACWIDPPKKGSMTTNGRCMCLDDLSKENQRTLMRRISLMQRTIKAQQKMIVAYRLGRSSLPDSVFDVLRKAREADLID